MVYWDTVGGIFRKCESFLLEHVRMARFTGTPLGMKVSSQDKFTSGKAHCTIETSVECLAKVPKIQRYKLKITRPERNKRMQTRFGICMKMIWSIHEWMINAWTYKSFLWGWSGNYSALREPGQLCWGSEDFHLVCNSLLGNSQIFGAEKDSVGKVVSKSGCLWKPQSSANNLLMMTCWGCFVTSSHLSFVKVFRVL